MLQDGCCVVFRHNSDGVRIARWSQSLLLVINSLRLLAEVFEFDKRLLKWVQTTKYVCQPH